MTRPHSFDVSSVTELGMCVPPSSFNSLQMPNVVVTPPEEEQAESPPFLYFDASKAATKSTIPDLEALDIALDVHQQIANTAPVFQRTNVSEETIIMPRKSGTMSFPSHEWQRMVTRELEADDDVVEVIKVRKYEGLAEFGQQQAVAQTMPRSKTLRARAAQAFRSIRNVGKGSRKPAVQETFNFGPRKDSVASDTGPQLSLGKAPSTRRYLSKARSRPLSQIFQFGRDEPESSLEPALQSPTSSSWTVPSSRPLSPSTITSPTSSSSLSPESDPPPLSSKSSTLPKHLNTFRKRMSQLELPRLFSSSSSSMSSTTTSEASSPSPPTPPSDIPEPNIALHESSSSADGEQSSSSWILSSLEHAEEDDDDEIDYGEVQALSSLSMVREEDSMAGDLSIEMRLDSLHFDSLSFDANDFTMNPLKNGGRRTSQVAVM